MYKNESEPHTEALPAEPERLLATKVIQEFIRTDRLHRQLVEARITNDVGLHRSQHVMLMHLSHAKEPPSQKELACHFDISPAAVTVTLNRLECGGYITRSNPEGDNRSNRIAITEKGREATRIFEKQLPYPVREAAQRSALRVVRQIRRDAGIHTAVTEHGPNDLTVRMEMEQVFAVEMNVVSHGQAAMLERTFKENAEAVYQTLLTAMTKNYANEKEAQKP